MTPGFAIALVMALLAAPSAAREPASGGPILKTDFQQTEAIIGQPLSLRLTILVPTYMPSPPVWPNLEGPNILVRLPEGSTSPTSEVRNSETWSGITRHYRIAPMVPGQFQLPPQDITVTYADPKTNAPLKSVLTTEAISFSGIVPAGAEAVDPFIAATDLTLTQDIEGDPTQMEPGQSLRLTLTAEVRGVSPMFLPPLLPQIAIRGIAAYPDEPVVEERSERGQLRGARRESVTLVAEGGGSGQVPPVELQWFDLDTNAPETASVKGFDISVQGPPARARNTQEGWSSGLSLAAVLAGLALFTLTLKRISPRLRRWVWNRRRARMLSEPYAFQALQDVVRRRDHGALRPALDTWASRTAGHADPRQQAELKAALLELGAAHYSPHAQSHSDVAAWNHLAATLPPARRMTLISTGGRRLPPLNPGT